MCKPWKPGESTPAATVSTVTLAYPLVKSMVASATCLPSAVFSCVGSFPAPDDPGEVVDVNELLEPWVEQPFIATTGMTNKATAAATCFIINGAYPRDGRRKRECAARGAPPLLRTHRSRRRERGRRYDPEGIGGSRNGPAVSVAEREGVPGAGG